MVIPADAVSNAVGSPYLEQVMSRKPDKGACPLGKPRYETKRDADAACGEREHPERCGRCRGWHPMPVKGNRR